MSTKKIILFDMDDTLVFTIDTGFKRVNYSLEKMDIPKITFQHFNKVYGHIPFPECISEWGISKDESETFLYYYEKSKEFIKYTSIVNMEEILNLIKENNLLIGIVSNTPNYKIEKKFNEVNFDKNDFDCIYCDAKKPSGDSILLALHDLDIQLQNAVYIGDSMVDYLAAKQAGIDFLGVLTGNTSRADFLQAGLFSSEILPEVNSFNLSKVIENHFLQEESSYE
ncbi:HAD family hydrolase [Lysinibacillus xylanilyticus]|uniref:HAD family hydrolase n=1 Tax=Lysinibacillus xylanilyticus TaxID=582475 RepID=UPI003D0185CC